MSEENKVTAEYQLAEVQDKASMVSYDELDHEVLSNYLMTWKQGGKDITTLSARGIEHIAAMFGISIVDQSMVETSDGNGYHFTAKAEDPAGRSNVASLWQTKNDRKGKFDPDALAKGSTRVNRNAIRGLIPLEMITARIQTAVQSHGKKMSELQVIQEECRQAIRDNQEGLSKLGFTSQTAFDKAGQQLGDVADWSIDDWKLFLRHLTNLSNSWYRDDYEDKPF